MSKGPPFCTIRVSGDLHRMVRDVEMRVRVCENATPEELPEAYACLCFSRKFLYEYLEDIERLAEVDPPDGWTHLRFV